MEAEIFTLTGENFKTTINQEKPVLVDFWAAWCGPCRMIAPILESVAREYDGKLIVAKLNVDDYGDIAAEYGIMSIPTLLLFKNGNLLGKLMGFQSRENVLNFIKRAV